MKTLTLLPLLSIIVFSVAKAQAPPIEWQNTIGGSGIDLLYSVQQTADGGYILGGESNSGITGDRTEIEGGCWVVKLDAAGNIFWQNTISGNGGAFYPTVKQTADGGYILGASSNSNIGYSDYWVAKLDTAGNILWQNTIGGSLSDVLISFDQTADGGYILGGYSSSGISGDKTEANQGMPYTNDIWLIKLDAAGNIVWQNTIGGDSTDVPGAIQQTADGGYILGGYSDSGISGDKTEANIGGWEDFWVLKLDSAGNIVWQNTIGGTDGDGISSLQQTTDGGYILGGYSISGISGDKTEASLGSGDYWVVKLDATGNIVWQNTIGGNRWDELTSIQQTVRGGYILGGFSSSDISGDKTRNSRGAEDYWIVELDAAGNVLWDKTIGGNTTDYCFSMQQTADEGYILGGYSYSGLSGDKTEGQTSYDYWVVKLGKFEPFAETVNGFTLVNAVSDQDISELRDDATINFVPLRTDKLNIRAEVTSPAIRSVVFTLNGVPFRTENAAPFALAGDGAGGNYLPWTPAIGSYNLCATPWSGPNGTGTPGVRSCVYFHVINFGVVNYTLVNTETNEDIYDFTPNGEVVELNLSGLAHPERVSIRVNTVPPVIPAMDIGVDVGEGGHIIEKTPPYAIFGDDNGNYRSWLKVGTAFPMGGSCGEQFPHWCFVTILNNPNGHVGTGDGIYDDYFEFNFKYDDIRVESFTLVNAVTNEDIQELQEGDVLDLSLLPATKLNIRANTRPPTVGSVVFNWNPDYQTGIIENIAPYALYGGDGGNYNDWQAVPGDYHIEAVPYSVAQISAPYFNPKGACGIPLSVSFQIIQSGANKTGAQNEPTASSALQVFPNPNEGSFNISFTVEETTDVKVEVYDLLGKTVYQDEVLSFTGAYFRKLDLSMYGQGIYLLKVQEGVETQMKKIVVN